MRPPLPHYRFTPSNPQLETKKTMFGNENADVPEGPPQTFSEHLFSQQLQTTKYDAQVHKF